MPELKGDKVPKLYFDKERGCYELFSNSGERIFPTLTIQIIDKFNDHLTASITLHVNVVNERPVKQ